MYNLNETGIHCTASDLRIRLNKMSTQVIERGSDPVGSEYFYRNSTEPDEIRTGFRSKGIRHGSDLQVGSLDLENYSGKHHCSVRGGQVKSDLTWENF
jgi:hypothetical protein